MLIDVKSMRFLRQKTTQTKYKLLEQNIERFFRDYIFYYNVFDGKELIIESGYLPFHYLDREVLPLLIDLFEKKLGYAIIIMKTTNINQKGYFYGDLINIRVFDPLDVDVASADSYFNMKIYQPLYSTLHKFNNINGDYVENNEYKTCSGFEFALGEEQNKNLLED